MLNKFSQQHTGLDLLRVLESCDGLSAVASPHKALHGYCLNRS